MTDLGVNPLEDTESAAALAYAEKRRSNIRLFVRTSPDYYIRNFDRIGASSRFTPTFNWVAGLMGPVLGPALLDCRSARHSPNRTWPLRRSRL